MPTYDYQCLKCASVFEIYHRINEQPQEGCPICGSHDIKKTVSGFYLGNQNQVSSSDMKADLKENYGIEGVQMKAGKMRDWYRGVKADGSRVREQMLAGEEKQNAAISKKNREFNSKPATDSKTIDKIIKQQAKTIKKG